MAQRRDRKIPPVAERRAQGDRLSALRKDTGLSQSQLAHVWDGRLTTCPIWRPGCVPWRRCGWIRRCGSRMRWVWISASSRAVCWMSSRGRRIRCAHCVLCVRGVWSWGCPWWRSPVPWECRLRRCMVGRFVRGWVAPSCVAWLRWRVCCVSGWGCWLAVRCRVGDTPTCIVS